MRKAITPGEVTPCKLRLDPTNRQRTQKTWKWKEKLKQQLRARQKQHAAEEGPPSDYKKRVKEIRDLFQSDDFKTFYPSRQTKIPSNLQKKYHQKLREELKKEYFEFHTYAPVTQRTK